MRTRLSQGGFTLTELMIATAIGMLIVVYVVEIHSDLSRANRELTTSNAQAEGARIALTVLKDDIEHAGYWGGYVPTYDDLTYRDVPGDEPTIVPDPCLTYASWDDSVTPGHINSMLGVGLQVSEDAPTSCTTLLPNKQAGTDVLVVRRARTCQVGEARCPTQIANAVYFQSSNCSLEIDVDNLYVLGQSGLTLRERDCDVSGGTIAALRQFEQNIYYVRDYFATVGDGIPTLMRSEFGVVGTDPVQLSAEPLVSGIERFRVELGIDSLSDTGATVNYNESVSWSDQDVLNSPINRGDGVHDGAYVHCGAGCTVNQLMNAVSARVYLVVRASETSPNYTNTKTYQLGSLSLASHDDSYKRLLVSTTTRLNTVSSRRETP